MGLLDELFRKLAGMIEKALGTIMKVEYDLEHAPGVDRAEMLEELYEWNTTDITTYSPFDFKYYNKEGIEVLDLEEWEVEGE